MGTRHKEARPENRRDFGDGMKLHLRVMTLAGKTYRVITLRPGTDVRFSTNYFHDTWHIISDPVGARLLGRLLWGLAYQKQERTLIVIHGEHIAPTPFDADPSLPFLLAPAHLTPLDEDAFRALKAHLERLPNPDCTIRWHTFGMPAPDEEIDWDAEFPHLARWPKAETRENVCLCGGFICVSALPDTLRSHAVHVSGMKMTYPDDDPQDYHYLAEFHGSSRAWAPHGEVQIFAAYHEKLSLAREARQDVEAAHLASHPPIAPDDMRQAVYNRYFMIEERRRHARTRRSRPTTPEQAS